MAKTDADREEDKRYIPKQPRRLAVDLTDLPKDWKDTYFTLGTEGASDASLYTAAGLTRSRHERLKTQNTEYAEWFQYCHEVSTAYWEDFSRIMCRRKDFNSATYNLVMMNRCGWNNTGRKEDAPPETSKADEPVQGLDEFKNPAAKTITQ